MKHLAHKIFILLGFTTLITISVVPLSTYAQSIPFIGQIPSITTSIIGAILYAVMRIIAVLLGLTGIILDGVIQMTVVNMAENLQKITAINQLWETVRDLGNMTFIFILLYQGIRMVLGLSGANIKKAITGIILAAILINFSLLFTKVVIDASNIVTLGFYNSISNAGGGTETIAGQNFNFGFSGAFMQPLGISGIWSVEGFEKLVKGESGRNGSEFIIYIGGSIFMLVAIFVFLAVSVLFIIRYLAFILLLIMSPIAFLNFAIDLGTLSKKYWDTLFGQALFGPVYMFLTWIVLSIARSDGFIQTGSLGESLANPNKDSISLIIHVVLLIGLLIFSVIQAKTFATKGGIVTSKMVDKGTGWVGGAVFGGASIAGRSTLGRWGQSVSEDKDLKARAAQGDLGARFKLLAGNKLATSSFDARNTETVGVITKPIGNFGKGINPKGYRGYVDEKLKKQAEKDKVRAEQFKVPEDKDALAEYERMLKDDPSIEENKRDYRKIILDTLIAEEKDKVKDEVSNIQKEIDKQTQGKFEFEAKKVKTEQEIKNLKELIRSASNALTDNSDLVAQYEVKLQEEQARLATLTEGINDYNKFIQEKKAVLNEVNKDVLALQLEKQEIEKGIWISPEYEQLIADAGGRGNKTEGKNGKEQKAVLGTSNKNILAYAERVKNKTGLFSGIPNFRIDSNYSKRRAAAVRKLTKEEKNTDKIAKLMKEMAKEDENTPTPPTNTTPTNQPNTPPTSPSPTP